MRIEAVQNERRPYTSKNDTMHNGDHNERTRKQNDINVNRNFFHKKISFFYFCFSH